ncbi:hypothetical protein CEH05_15395 [Halobacillus halophilus]|uniref:GAF domain-containing protein n=1 Tax=Halobacillus halophilus (strain ATCC 35676 / DSM 2266 / JCM 20832 / KCTC 3685 / LMG 17431 / NBRC 102448 / NCIMB 2269) TaxID=866895 RepID=I0JQM7_HALH3|nr:hypothetical protein [Halobacillus halophilus]ASF40458.1 hypothetical protein CEH05_15395 [Halobacillus halophilus]CCG46447.1 conserved hypothetical protein [Halobacillus halophilus DSM 2266]
MIYTQTSTWRKFIELFVIMLIAALLDQYLEMNMTQWTLSPFIMIVLFFSLRYGLTLGLSAFLLTVSYLIVSVELNNGDLFLLFYESDTYLVMLFTLLIAVISGTYSTSFKERYESLTYSYGEIMDERNELKKTIELMKESQRVMQEKVLDSEYTLSRIYQVGIALDQPTPDLIRNEATTIISNLFKAEEVGIYHLDSSRKALRLHVRNGESKRLPQTLFIDEHSFFYKRIFQNKTVTIRTVDDDENTPLVAGPIVSNNEVEEVLIIDQLDFSRLTKYEIQIMSLVLDWMSNRMERAKEAKREEDKENMYPGTRVYYADVFEDLVDVQRMRKEHYHVPFSVVSVDLSSHKNLSVIETEIILRAYLRELDVIGFNQETHTFYFLLPGTEEAKAWMVEKRIKQALRTKGVMPVG